MNKKLLFAAMSLAVLTACSTDDIESQKVAQEAGSVQFEFVNNNDATRAAMQGLNNNKLVWSAEDNDLLTLYHGATIGATTGYQNATYTIVEGAEGETAKLRTPSMILKGGAIMVWPADTTFRIASDGNLSVTIPAEQDEIAYQIPFVSDQINIGDFSKLPKDNTEPAYNTAGWNRTYPIYMRPMASQLNIKADYAGTDAVLEELYKGDDPIKEITVTNIDLITKTGGSTQFSTELPIKFEDPNTAWSSLPASVHQAWAKVTTVNKDAAIASTDKLTTTFLNGNDGGKFLILPQKTIGTDGVDEAAVVVNTYYGKVVVAPNGVQGSKYKATPNEAADAWYRFVKEATIIDPATDNETKATSAETDGDNAGKYKVTADIAHGMKQTINFFSGYKAPETNQYVKGEYQGTPITRYVKVLLTHLDMSDLHVKDDKQLRDVARVWKQMGLDPVTVYLDGGQADATKGTKNFQISQKTIKVINEVNASTLGFQVKPCNEAGEECTQIVITGSSDIQNVQDIAFITYNDVDKNGSFNSGDIQAQVVLAKEAKPWKWNGTVKVAADGVERIINKGTMENAAKATLQTAEYDGTQNNVRLQNDGTWDIKTGTILNVQFDVTNNGTVTIEKNAQYRQDGRKNDINTLTTFTNEATAVPTRFGGNDDEIGLVNNSGVFATVALGQIINYGLIEHIEDDAKTYITKNQTPLVSFSNAFSDTNKRGRINLRFSNKNEDNISVSAAASEGFISVTVTADDLEKAGITSDELDASIVGDRVNYIIINSGIKTISKVSPQVQYLEIAAADKKEIAWNVTDATEYVGLMVLSDVNVKLNTTINVTRATYLGADMYVGGTFTTAAWNGYYGKTEPNVASQYITY